MSEYWKSNAKKFCDYCKIWIADNKASINIHESGRKHKENVKTKLAEIKQKSNEKKAEDAKTAKAMAAIEKAAMNAMQKDLSSNPRLKNQYGNEAVKAASSAAAAAEEALKEKKTEKKVSKPSKPKISSTVADKQAVKRKAEESEGKIGKWESVVPKKPVIETPTSSVDLQLPNSSISIISSKLESSVEQLQNELDTLDKEITEAAPKPKWNPIGFQSIDIEESQKEENVKPIKEEAQEKVEIIQEEEQVYAQEFPVFEPVQPEKVEKPAEKVVTLEGMFKSSKKPIAFKQRKANAANLRERTDE